jgi:NAD(P)-dependent dehydrogenase (short-subunit alcohol dehydrogenase family)
MVNELAGKTYLVTGASSGIGRCVSVQLDRVGANVVLLARDKKRLGETLHMMPRGTHKSISYDLQDIGGIAELVKSSLAGDGMDGYVHCAGIERSIGFTRMTRDALHSVMATNFYAFVEMARQLIKGNAGKDQMSIVVISSAASNSFSKGMTAYAASKAALEAAVRTMSAELLSRNITVNAIRPGFVDTPMLSKLRQLDDGFDERVRENQPLGLLQPEDVANLILYLLSPAARMISGMLFPVNGGSRIL